LRADARTLPAVRRIRSVGSQRPEGTTIPGSTDNELETTLYDASNLDPEDADESSRLTTT
jgi:hypothetical protein